MFYSIEGNSHQRHNLVYVPGRGLHGREEWSSHFIDEATESQKEEETPDRKQMWHLKFCLLFSLQNVPLKAAGLPSVSN